MRGCTRSTGGTSGHPRGGAAPNLGRGPFGRASGRPTRRTWARRRGQRGVCLRGCPPRTRPATPEKLAGPRECPPPHRTGSTAPPSRPRGVLAGSGRYTRSSQRDGGETAGRRGLSEQHYECSYHAVLWYRVPGEAKAKGGDGEERVSLMAEWEERNRAGTIYTLDRVQPWAAL